MEAFAIVAILAFCPILHHLRRRNRASTLLLSAIAGTTVGLGGLLLPWGEDAVMKGLWVIAPLLLWGSFSSRWLERLTKLIRRHGAIRSIVVSAVTLCLTLGGLEWCAWQATSLGWVTLPVPIRIDRSPDTQDFRLFHMFVDSLDEPDPVLLWKHRDTPPYNRQGFQGRLVEVPKPARVHRTIAYGDSNTDGGWLPEGAWPRALQALVGDASEVLNAGVAGYSSHQGLLRFRQDAPTFRPDLVLVSFGWNDAADGIDKPDEDYLPAAAAIGPLRVAMKYRSFRLAQSLFVRPPSSRPRVARVSLEDYEQNLLGFVDAGRRIGARVVLLTRPHREPEAEMARARDWHRRVPRYDARLRELAGRRRIRVVDAQRALAGKPWLFQDECHLSSRGHVELARIVHEAVFASRDGAR